MEQRRRRATPARPRRSGRRTVATLIAEGLAEAGVKWAFTVPGESFLGLLDALAAAGITVVATRHEGGAAFMAEAVGQLTGKPAAVLGTRAVGAANMSIGLHTARQNSTPLVALVGQVPREMSGREAFQEVDQVGSFGRLVKWAAQIDDPAAAVDLIGRGLSMLKQGRPGPVLFALPEDVLEQPARRADIALIDRHEPAPPDPDLVERAVALLSRSQRPAVLAGGGVGMAGARDALVRWSEQMELPVFAAWRRPTVFPNDHPHYLGMTGFGAPSTVAERLKRADALLVIGCRLNEVASFKYAIPDAGTEWVHVDLEPRDAANGLSAPDIAIAGDAGTFLELAVAQTHGYSGPREKIEALAADRAAYVAARTPGENLDWRGPGVHPARVMATLQHVLSPETILTTDAGNFGLWLARHFQFGRGHGFLGPTSGAMGYGLPAAIAASLCEPRRTVVALCGDGGMAMTMSELETAVRSGAKPVVLVFDNQRYGTIAMYQQRAGRETVATELGGIDFAAVARACGAQGGRVTRDVEFEPALRDALAANRPAVLQLQLDRRWVTPDEPAPERR